VNLYAKQSAAEPVSVMERSEMKVRNKLTKEILDIPYSEFRKKFVKEIQRIFGRAMLSDSEQARKVPVGHITSRKNIHWMFLFGRVPKSQIIERVFLEISVKHN